MDQGGQGARRWPVDMFLILNLLLFLALWWALYPAAGAAGRAPFDRQEFLIYGAVILLVILIGRIRLGKIGCPLPLLLMVQAGIIAHFAGGLVAVGGTRLYDARFLGLGFDNYIHVYNAFVGAALIGHVLRGRIPEAARPAILIGLTLGAGAVVEIVEFLVVQAIPTAGVGDYANNMRDLIANAIGASVYACLFAGRPEQGRLQ
jgi:hypothetical protein